MFVDYDHAFLPHETSEKKRTYETWNEVHIVYQHQETNMSSKKPLIFFKTLVIQEESTRTFHENPRDDLEDILDRVGYSFVYHLGNFLEPQDLQTIHSVKSACESRNVSWNSVICVYRTMNGDYLRAPKDSTNEAHNVEREAYEALQWWSLRPSFIETVEDVQHFVGSKTS